MAKQFILNSVCNICFTTVFVQTHSFNCFALNHHPSKCTTFSSVYVVLSQKKECFKYSLGNMKITLHYINMRGMHEKTFVYFFLLLTIGNKTDHKRNELKQVTGNSAKSKNKRYLSILFVIYQQSLVMTYNPCCVPKQMPCFLLCL